jgi:hypothetical protein
MQTNDHAWTNAVFAGVEETLALAFLGLIKVGLNSG